MSPTLVCVVRVFRLSVSSARQWSVLAAASVRAIRSKTGRLLIPFLAAPLFSCALSQQPDILELQSNDILTAVVQGARKEEPSAEVQIAAINALFNSLEFVRVNMEREGERNFIMQIVCEATQNPSIPVVVGAYECLVKIMQLYYDKMGFYMEQALFGVRALSSPSHSVACSRLTPRSPPCLAHHPWYA